MEFTETVTIGDKVSSSYKCETVTGTAVKVLKNKVTLLLTEGEDKGKEVMISKARIFRIN